MSEKITDEPRFADKNYLEKYSQDCIEGYNHITKKEYYGLGISINDHPLFAYCDMTGCGNCKSNEVKVIYAQWVVQMHSGNKYYDYELYCEKCGKYTSHSYSDA